jgi:hypothetical protein
MRWLDRLLSRPAAAPAPSEPPEPQPPPLESHRSAAVEEVVAVAGRHPRGLAVLDLGPARASTFDFLTPLARSVRVADLETGLRRGTAAELAELLCPATEPWDLVLAWDLLDRLERSTSKRLAKHLEGQLADGAVVHLLASRHREIDAVAPIITFADGHTLTIQRRTLDRREGPGWTQRELSMWLAGCEPGPSALHQTGFVEVLLRRTATS